MARVRSVCAEGHGVARTGRRKEEAFLPLLRRHMLLIFTIASLCSSACRLLLSHLWLGVARRSFSRQKTTCSLTTSLPNTCSACLHLSPCYLLTLRPNDTCMFVSIGTGLAASSVVSWRKINCRQTIYGVWRFPLRRGVCVRHAVEKQQGMRWRSTEGHGVEKANNTTTAACLLH